MKQFVSYSFVGYCLLPSHGGRHHVPSIAAPQSDGEGNVVDTNSQMANAKCRVRAQPEGGCQGGSRIAKQQGAGDRKA